MTQHALDSTALLAPRPLCGIGGRGRHPSAMSCCAVVYLRLACYARCVPAADPVFCNDFASGLYKRCSRLHFQPFLDLERLKNRQTEKCIKMLELRGGEVFSTKR